MYVIANHKENLLLEDHKLYLSEFKDFCKKSTFTSKVIFCPSFPFLSTFSQELLNIKNVSLGAQDVSKFTGGSYTGEVSSEQIKAFCSHCIVGHSERRKNFNESVKDVNIKITNLLRCSIRPVVCVSNLEQLTSLENLEDILIAYEPVEYIGGVQGVPVSELKAFYKKTGLSKKIIYGGSVNANNVKDFLQLDFIHGFLIGGASLDLKEFTKTINILG
jgi:triosephosphate isomerase